MTTRNVEIEDDLQERIDGAVEEIIDRAKEYLEDNPDKEYTEVYELIDDLDYDGTVHELIDSWVPIYTSEIRGLWYLYSDEFIQAYNDMGIGDGTEDNYQTIAIWCYLDQKVREELSDSTALEIMIEETQED
jgi:hypothetical protein